MGSSRSPKSNSNRIKFFIGGLFFFAAVVFMVISATRTTAEFFMTVTEVKETKSDLSGQNLRVSGAVLGDSISYDGNTGLLHFSIAHIPADVDEINDRGGLYAVLHQAVNDPGNSRLSVIYDGPQPDMLRDEAQAIVTGTLNSEGIFIAEELLLKCPSKYEEAIPNQVGN